MTSPSRFESGVELHSTRIVAASSRVMWVELSLLVVFFVKWRKDNIGRVCRVWSPGHMVYACRGIRVPDWFFGYFMIIHAFRQQSFSPLCHSINPPQMLEVAAGERKSLFYVERPLLGSFLFLGELCPL